MSDNRQGATGAALLGPAGRNVAQRLESVTRFDAEDLIPLGPEELLRTTLTLHVRQEVSFTVASQDGTGALPQGVGRVSTHSLDALGPALQSAKAGLEGRVPSALQTWANGNAQSYRLLLPSIAALGLSAITLGCEVTCRTCSGSAQVLCYQCSGMGHSACHYCSSTGEQRCNRCAGSGTSQCTGCNGSGGAWETLYESVWDASSNSHVQQARQVSRLCFSCGGNGRQNCGGCGGRRYVTCSTCGGNRQINCSACFTSGYIACGGCSATGLLHAWGSVSGGVNQTEAVVVDSDDKELVRLLKERANPENLPGYGAFLSATHEVSSSRLTSKYRVAIEVSRAPIGVHSNRGARAGRFTFYGFGAKGEVLDHCNLEGHVLAGDLEELEAEVSKASRFGSIRPQLVERTIDFIESELNLLILQRVAGRKALTPVVKKEVEDHFAGMVSEAYVERAVTSLRRSFSLVYWARVIKPAFAIVLTFALAIGLSLTLPTPIVADAAWVWAGGILAAAVLGWFALERWAAKSVTQVFGIEAGSRVLGELRVSKSLTRLRIGAALALLCASLAFHMLGLAVINLWHRTAVG